MEAADVRDQSCEADCGVLVQSLEPSELSSWDGCQKTHLKDSSSCSDVEKTDEKNLLVISPLLHKSFDGNGFRAGLLIGLFRSIKTTPGESSNDSMALGDGTRQQTKSTPKCYGPDSFTVEGLLNEVIISMGNGKLVCIVRVKGPTPAEGFVR